ncbi:MAG: hypothetical protein A4E50_01853 [Methanosaeta sp. PtaB.Bin087]|nr:MAG: hypothetical protein A4E50_01853 [Methanosaeta sp. PtaB.Bin087]
MASHQVSPKKEAFSRSVKRAFNSHAEARTRMETIAALGPRARPEVAARRMATRSPTKIGGMYPGLSDPNSDDADGLGQEAASSSSDPLSKMAAMMRPMRTEIETAAMIRAAPSSSPRTRAVRTTARRFMAGPAKRKAVAGPMPAPRRWIPAKIGRIVQLQTARMVPEVEATE